MGVWLINSFSQFYYDWKFISIVMKQLQDVGFNCVVFNVWSCGIMFYCSCFVLVELLLQKVGIVFDFICIFVVEGWCCGIKVMFWFEYGLMELVDFFVVSNNLSWVLVKVNGQCWMVMYGNYWMVWFNLVYLEVCVCFIGLVVEILKCCLMDGF